MASFPLSFITIPLSILYIWTIVSCVLIYLKKSWIAYLPTISESALSRVTGGIYAAGMTALSLILMFATFCIALHYGIDCSIHGGFSLLLILCGVVTGIALSIQGVFKIKLESEDDIHKQAAGIGFMGLFGVIINDFVLDLWSIFRTMDKMNEFGPLDVDSNLKDDPDSIEADVGKLLSSGNNTRIIEKGHIIVFILKALIIVANVFYVGNSANKFHAKMLDKATMSMKPVTQKRLDELEKDGESNNNISSSIAKEIKDYGKDIRIPDGYALVKREDELYVVSSSPEYIKDMNDAALMQYAVVGLSLLYLSLMGYGVRVKISIK